MSWFNDVKHFCRQTKTEAMPDKWCSLLLGLAALSLAPVTSSTNEIITNSFLVRFKRNVDSHTADEVAKRNSFHNIGEVSCARFIVFCKIYSTPRTHVDLEAIWEFIEIKIIFIGTL